MALWIGLHVTSCAKAGPPNQRPEATSFATGEASVAMPIPVHELEKLAGSPGYIRLVVMLGDQRLTPADPGTLTAIDSRTNQPVFDPLTMAQLAQMDTKTNCPAEAYLPGDEDREKNGFIMFCSGFSPEYISRYLFRTEAGIEKQVTSTFVTRHPSGIFVTHTLWFQ